QAHVTNLRDNPVQIAADAAEAAIRGFDEQETTVAVVRYAPFNALSLLVGSQTGRGGVLTQCSLEEATELELGMRGLTCYAETISVYGTEPVFTDGDDTPWSKGILASAYASRGLKMRFTSGTGSEVQMGYAEGKSMLYLESRCIFITKAAGVQGLQ
ncbi:propanediol dehydratase, partial [Listeria monocytogenes]|nr:propanediol dehydratase [Listeria monocytogenes]